MPSLPVPLKWLGVSCIYIFVVEVAIPDELVAFKCVDKAIQSVHHSIHACRGFLEVIVDFPPIILDWYRSGRARF